MIERRNTSFKQRVFREVSGTGENRIFGYAAVFYDPTRPGTEYWIADDIVERIRPGAFDAVLKTSDCRALFNHNANNILGRESSGTLQLSVDQLGLRYAVDLPDTTVGGLVNSAVRRRDVDGSSFAFTVARERYETLKDGTFVRWIEEIGKLLDVGPTTFAAYSATTSEPGDDEDDDEAESSPNRLAAMRTMIMVQRRALEIEAAA